MLLIVFHVTGSTAKGMHVKVTWGCIIFVEHAQNTAAWMMLVEYSRGRRSGD